MRYIDADNFRKTMIKRFGCIPCLTDYSDASRYDIPIDDALNLEPTADVVPKKDRFLIKENGEVVNLTARSEARDILYDLKHKIHDKAVRPNNAGIDAYISLKVFDAVLQGYLNKLE